MSSRSRLTRALDRQEFLLHYQPKINIRNGKLEGMEALLRWQDSQDGLVPPSVFIPMLEQSCAIVDVGEWVFMASKAKPRRELVRDIGSIVLVQLCALLYGSISLWNGRPLYYAFSVNILQLVQAYDIDSNEAALALKRTRIWLLIGTASLVMYGRPYPKTLMSG